MTTIQKLLAKQSLPYILIFILSALQFGYVYFNNAEERPPYFWAVVIAVLGMLCIQIFRNGRIFHLIITVLFTLLIGYLLLAFLSDLVKNPNYDWSFFRFLGLGILLFGFLIFIEVLLFRSKPRRNF